MNDRPISGARKTPEEEIKFGPTLRAQLYIEPEEPVNVVVFGKDRPSDDSSLSEFISDSLPDTDIVQGLGGAMITAYINPPGIRRKLASIATNEEVQAIELNEPLTTIPIQKSYFRE